MKKFLPLAILGAIIVVSLWFVNPTTKPVTTASSSSGAKSGETAVGSATTEGAAPVSGEAGTTGASRANIETAERMLAGDEEEFSEEDIRPAADVYRSSEDALKAVRNGAVDYDDLVLEQFTDLGDCSWCEEFYKEVHGMLASPETPTDHKSYYAELLAVSGKVENVKSLVEGIKNSPNQETTDIYMEALELTSGKDDVVSFLGNELETAGNNEPLKESLVAALTNQGSRLAADVLYKETVESGSPDGYYSLGIGLGELIPDEDAIPYLQDLMLKKDKYSHLAVKSLLNSGVDGLRLVFDALTNSKDPEFDRQMLKDAVDHVNYEPEIEDYVKKLAGSPQPVVSEFANQILEDFGTQEDIDLPEE